MRLSMWMIANQLNNFDLEINIKKDAPIILRSARRAYATDCVHIFQSGNDVVCNGEGDYIRLKDINANQAFEIVQSIFDFYDDWSSAIYDAASQLNFQAIVDISWHAFHNPIILLNANYKVIAMSERYGEYDIDLEWNHLKSYGYSSFEAIKFLQEEYDFKNKFSNQYAQLFEFSKKNSKQILKTDCLSSSIYCDNLLCGRINILEKDRPLNNGDVQLLNYLASIISPSIDRLISKEKNRTGHNVLFNLLNGESVDLKDLQRQLEYMEWKQDHILRICVLKSYDEKNSNKLLLMTCGLIKNQLLHSESFVIDNHIVIIFNEMKISYTIGIEVLQSIAKKSSMRLGISLPVKKLDYINIFYNQALYAVEYGNLYSSNDILFNFYDYAIDYIIESRFTADLLCACHPDIILLWESDQESDGNKILTLHSYLNNERSLIHTAREMFVHRNTLAYRIKKITDMMKFDINDIYTRDYMMLSIKVLYLYKRKYQRLCED